MNKNHPLVVGYKEALEAHEAKYRDREQVRNVYAAWALGCIALAFVFACVLGANHVYPFLSPSWVQPMAMAPLGSVAIACVIVIIGAPPPANLNLDKLLDEMNLVGRPFVQAAMSEVNRAHGGGYTSMGRVHGLVSVEVFPEGAVDPVRVAVGSSKEDALINALNAIHRKQNEAQE